VALILDACHSGGSVDTPNFKPGPMGAKGLGQLACDKGMMVLAATRKDELAWESGAEKEGLLTFALVREGLQDNRADFQPTDGVIGLRNWLRFGSQEVPRLLSGEQLDSNGQLLKFDLAARDVSSQTKPDTATKVQRPVLFDFKRGDDTVVLKRLTAAQ
jgi:hypothetical protein